MEDWNAVNQVVHSGAQSRNLLLQKWEKPTQGWLKLNIDAAIDKHNHKMGLGWIMRGEEGHFMAAKCYPLHGNFSPKEAEAVAVREALSWLKNRRHDKVLVETDSLLVTNALLQEKDVSAFDLLILDIKDIAKRFNNINISFVKRSANQSAHKLARTAVSMSDCGEWFLPPPLPPLSFYL